MFNKENSNDLRLTMETIALEASVLSNMVQTVKKLFPSLIEGVSGSFTSVKNLEKVELTHSSLQKDVIKKLGSTSYMDLDKLKVAVPEGFDADYITALDVCSQALDYMEFIKEVVIKDFRIYVSTFISNKDSKISTKDITYKNATNAEKAKQLNEIFSTLYKANSFSIESTYFKLVKRNADVETVFSLHNKIVARLKAFDLQYVKSEIEDIVSLIDVIIKQVNEDKIESISPEAVKNIAEGTYSLAKQVETVSACYFRISTITVSIDNFTQTMNKRLSY